MYHITSRFDVTGNTKLVFCISSVVLLEFSFYTDYNDITSYTVPTYCEFSSCFSEHQSYFWRHKFVIYLNSGVIFNIYYCNKNKKNNLMGLWFAFKNYNFASKRGRCKSVYLPKFEKFANVAGMSLIVSFIAHFECQFKMSI